GARVGTTPMRSPTGRAQRRKPDESSCRERSGQRRRLTWAPSEIILRFFDDAVFEDLSIRAVHVRRRCRRLAARRTHHAPATPDGAVAHGAARTGRRRAAPGGGPGGCWGG